MQKLVLNPTYSRFFDSNGNSTLYPPGFFELSFRNQYPDPVFHIFIRIVHPLATLLPQFVSESCKAQLERITTDK